MAGTQEVFDVDHRLLGEEPQRRRLDHDELAAESLLDPHALIGRLRLGVGSGPSWKRWEKVSLMVRILAEWEPKHGLVAHVPHSKRSPPSVAFNPFWGRRPGQTPRNPHSERAVLISTGAAARPTRRGRRARRPCSRTRAEQYCGARGLGRASCA